MGMPNPRMWVVLASALQLAPAWGINLAHAQTSGIERDRQAPAVLNTGYWVKDSSTRRSVDWIDNNRVIFAGGSYQGWDHNKLNPTAVYVFNLRTRQVTKLANEISYCFKQTEIRYTASRTPDGIVIRTIKRNESTPETEVVRTSQDIEAESAKAKARDTTTHPLICEGYSPSELAGANWEKYRLIGLFPLLAGHGYLDVYGRDPRSNEPPFDTEPARWFPAGGGAPKNLPMPKRVIAAYQIEYSEWNNLYVLRSKSRLFPPDYEPPGRGERWPRGMPLPVWLLRSDGGVERREVPYSSWIENYGRIYSSRVGFLVSRDVNTEPAGLYLVVDTKLVRFVQGSTVGVAVSPDGCKVAVAITTDFNNRDGGLKVASLCTPEKS